MYDFDCLTSYHQLTDLRTKKQKIISDIKMLASIKYVESFTMWVRLWRQLFCHIFIES